MLCNDYVHDVSNDHICKLLHWVCEINFALSFYQMDTHESVPPNDLSEIFSILEGEASGIYTLCNVQL